MIREALGFGGLLMTDDLSMGALPGSIGSARGGHRAGCDLILHCNGRRAEMEEVLAEAGTLDADALARSEAALALRDGGSRLTSRRLRRSLSAFCKGSLHG
jgi:beta-N-acetylhexosaminidase